MYIHILSLIIYMYMLYECTPRVALSSSLGQQDILTRLCRFPAPDKINLQAIAERGSHNKSLKILPRKLI